MIKYGLISQTDARTLERTIDLVCKIFEDRVLSITEVGIYSGETGNGMRQYVKSKGRSSYLTGIDNGADSEAVRFNYSRMIAGNSNVVYNELDEESQHIIFIDANHSLPYVICDAFCYMSKVKLGGFLCFHDTGEHIDRFTHYQKVGSEQDEDMYISVREALTKIGLMNNMFPEWKLIFDEADPNDEAGGVTVFQKLY